jgi:hypothetical protein
VVFAEGVGEQRLDPHWAGRGVARPTRSAKTASGVIPGSFPPPVCAPPSGVPRGWERGSPDPHCWERRLSSRLACPMRRSRHSKKEECTAAIAASPPRRLESRRSMYVSAWCVAVGNAVPDAQHWERRSPTCPPSHPAGNTVLAQGCHRHVTTAASPPPSGHCRQALRKYIFQQTNFAPPPVA